MHSADIQGGGNTQSNRGEYILDDVKYSLTKAFCVSALNLWIKDSEDHMGSEDQRGSVTRGKEDKQFPVASP